MNLNGGTLATGADNTSTTYAGVISGAGNLVKTGAGAMTRQKDGQGTFSATGVYGDPTLASAEKGRVLVEAVVAGALDDIEKIRAAPLPEAKKATPPPAPPRPTRPTSMPS